MYRRSSTPCDLPPMHPCPVCKNLLGPFGDWCSTCNFVNECVTRAKSHCAVISIPRYQLYTFPRAVKRFRDIGWDVTVKPRTGVGAWVSRAAGLDNLDLEMSARSVSSCNGRPVSRNDEALPTPCMVQYAKTQQCDSCAFRRSPPAPGEHDGLLRSRFVVRTPNWHS